MVTNDSGQSPSSNATGIGVPVRRKEDQRFITGKGRYTDDINQPGQTHGVFVRSPHAHAGIKSIDRAPALALPGVIAVLDGKDLATDEIGGLICGWMIHSKDGSEMKVGDHPALALDTVRYVGDHVAIVIAETREAAKDGAEAVVVDYDERPAVIDLGSAQKAAAVHEIAADNTIYDWELGLKAETDAAFEKAAHVVSIDLTNNRLVPNALEPRAAIGSWDAAADSYTLYTTSQNPHVARLILSAFIGIAPEHKLRVIAPDVGGGFGSKIFVYAEETVCVWASKKVGRPVKWTSDRSEAFLSDCHGRDHISHAELALAQDGEFLGLRVKTLANMGAYLSTFSSSVPTYLYGTLLSGQYNIPAIYVEVDAIYTHTAPVDAYRGAGRPEAAYLVERLVDRAAHQLGKDPADLRRQNFIREFPHETPVIMAYDIGDFGASLDRALEMSNYSGFDARRAEAEARGQLRGIGISTYIEACGIAPSKAVGSLGAGVGLWESAEVRVNPTGSVEVLTGSHSTGQGHETTFAQVVSDKFGIPVEDVEIVHGDTDKVQFGMGTYGSRSGPVGMSALANACDKVTVKAKHIAAHLLGVDVAEVSLTDGVFAGTSTNETLAFGEVSLAAYMAHNLPEDGPDGPMEPGLTEKAFYDPENFTFPAGCHICEVEIDPDTGVTRIVSFVAVDDFGTVINPMIVEGQVHGGLAQGIGQALLEESIYDRESGQLVTGSFMDYTMPRADDLPAYKVDMTVTKCPSNPLGVKGCGEAGAIGSPPAVINAVAHAIGNDEISMPATPQKIWRVLQESA